MNAFVFEFASSPPVLWCWIECLREKDDLSQVATELPFPISECTYLVPLVLFRCISTPKYVYKELAKFAFAFHFCFYSLWMTAVTHCCSIWPLVAVVMKSSFCWLRKYGKEQFLLCSYLGLFFEHQAPKWLAQKFNNTHNWFLNHWFAALHISRVLKKECPNSHQVLGSKSQCYSIIKYTPWTDHETHLQSWSLFRVV